MKNRIIYVFAFALLIACGNSPQPISEETTIATTDEVAIESTTRGAEHLCYQLKEGQDITAVSLTIENDSKVTGTYEWVPFEKDARVGKLTGTLQEGTIEATYTYIQEGEEGTEKITLVLQPEGVQVSGEEKELPQVDCK